MLAKRIKVLALSLVMLFSTASLFAVEEYVSKVYKNIDLIFVAKSGTDLNKILSEYTEDQYYYLIENYTEKKIRRLIVNNDYDFAMEAIVIVIENNLDNEQAVEMYSVISDAYQVQQEHERQEELKRQQEIARVEAEKEKKRASVDKEYVSASKSQGGSVYVAGKETKLTSYHWKASLGLVDLAHVLETGNDFSSLYYGPSVDFSYDYITPKVIAGTDIFGAFNILGFDQEATKQVGMVADIDLLGKVAFPFAKHLFIRAGLAALIAGDGEMDTVAVAQPSMYTPSLGLKIEKVKLTFNLGVRDKIFMKSTGIENRGSVILAIGVENVVK